MALIPTYLRRPTAILHMPEAILRGMTAEGFIRQLKAQGLSYRRTLMLSDWRSLAGIQAKKDTIKYVRRDRIPTTKFVADVEWNLSEEYMYKCKVHSQINPHEPTTERFVNIMSEKPLTPLQVYQEVRSRWGEWETYSTEQLKDVTLETAFHKVTPPEE